MSKRVIIYGVKTNDDKFHYIGKTEKKVNKRNELNKSDVTRQYLNNDIRTIFNENVNVIPIEYVKENEWYDKKLINIVKKYNEKHPLKNAKWMLEGKRGFWEGTGGYWKGKKKDDFTLQRLSESKFKKIAQYDNEGNLIKIWKSGKDVGIEIFKDYKIINGSGCTNLYIILENKTLRGRFKYNFYWFKEDELIYYFNNIPIKLNLNNIKEKEKIVRKEASKKALNNRLIFGQKKYTIEQFNKNGKLIKTYINVEDASKKLKKSIHTIRDICNNKRKKYDENCILKYGEKILQPIKKKD